MKLAQYNIAISMVIFLGFTLGVTFVFINSCQKTRELLSYHLNMCSNHFYFERYK